MPRVSVTARLPKSVWQLFHIALRRDGLTMQAWVERAVHRAAVEGETMSPLPPGSAEKLPLKGGATKQAIARLDRDELTRVRTKLREGRMRFNRWLVGQVIDYVRAERLRASELLPSRVLDLLGNTLPVDPERRETVAYALLDWPEEAILAAAAEPSFGVRDAVRRGDAELLSEILAVAQQKLVFQKRLDGLRAKQESRRRM